MVSYDYEILPTRDITNDGWREQAACRSVEDASIFLYPKPGRAPSAVNRPHDLAKAVCARCVVRMDCELAGKDAPGIWGGFTEHERIQRRSRRRRGLL